MNEHNANERRVCGATRLAGTLTVPGDKSVSHRALIAAALCVGRARITNLAPGRDVASTADCLRALGVRIEAEADTGAVVVHSTGPDGFRAPAAALDAGNSGTTMRLLTGLLAAQGFSCVLTGDDSLRRRPMRRVVDPLRAMGARITAEGDGVAPLLIDGGPLTATTYRLPIASAQVKSCLMLAGLFARGEQRIIEPAASRDHTERLLGHLGFAIGRDPDAAVGEGELAWRVGDFTAQAARDLDVPGDISSAAYFLGAAALRPGSELRLEGVGVNPTRTGVIDVLEAMGAKIEIADATDRDGEPRATLIARGADLRATEIAGALIPRVIDELPLLAVVATQADGETVIADAGELRVKESDRIASTVDMLLAFGADAEERSDGLVVRGPTPLEAAVIDGAGDHRIVMSCAVAALCASGETRISGAGWADISYPQFWADLDRVRTT